VEGEGRGRDYLFDKGKKLKRRTNLLIVPLLAKVVDSDPFSIVDLSVRVADVAACGSSLARRFLKIFEFGFFLFLP
jgi:hypothetical protein